MKGARFGKLVVLNIDNKRDIGGNILWVCQCDCGKKSITSSTRLKRGIATSCGCHQIEVAKNRKKHGATVGGKESPEYNSWCSMKSRCNNPKNPQYNDYGGRGITVCVRWLDSFENFISDMGPRPSLEHTLDRYPDNDGNYGPKNCRWGTKGEQSRGKRNNVYCEYEGERMILMDWAIRLGVPRHSMLHHIQKGKPFNEIVEHFKNRKTKQLKCN